MKRIDRMRKDYERFTKADSYIIGFDMNGLVYGAKLDKIPRRYIKIQKECSKAGGGYGLYINVKSMKARKELMKKAVLVCSVADLENDTYNKGVMFEKFIYEMNGQEFRGKDNVPFYMSGDITLDGKEVQIKYLHARICYDKTLTKLKNGSIMLP